MAQAKRDENQVPTLLAVSNADELTPVVVWADPSTHRLLVDANVSVNTEYAEDSAASSGATGSLILGVRQDATGSPVSADGDYQTLLFDSSGNLKVTSSGGSGGTQYSEDDAHTTADTGTMALAVRRDTAAVGSDTDGDYSTLNVDASGRLWAHDPVAEALLTTIDTDTGAMATLLGTIDADTGNAVALLTTIDADTGSMATLLGTIDADTSLLAGAVSGTEVQVDVVGALPTGANTIGSIASITTSIVPGTAATNLGKAEDAAHTTGDTGVMALAVRSDTASALAGTTGDYIPLTTDNAGKLWIVGSQLEDGAHTSGDKGIFALGVRNDSNASRTSADGDYSPISVDTGGNVKNVGNVAHDAADSGNPVKVGAKASNSIEGLTQVANGDRTDLVADLNGVLITRPHTTLEEIITERVADTAGTSAAFTNFAAGGAGIHNYITTITVYNSSATDGYVDLRDGTAGSVIFTVPAPTLGGSVITFPVPLKFGANTAVAYDVSGALSTVYISVVGFQAQG